MKEINLVVENEQVVVSSLEVAENFGKNHRDVLELIRKLTAEIIAVNLESPFYETTYKNERGREYPMFIMNRDGFTELVMNFATPSARQWKRKYIQAFNQMEETLKQGTQLTTEQKAQLMLFSKDPNEVVKGSQLLVEIATAPLVETIEKQKPKVEFAETLMASEDTISVEEFAKATHKEFGMGRNQMFKYLRDNGVLIKKGVFNVPKQQFINQGYFEVEEKAAYNVFTQTNTVNFMTRITPKGQAWLYKNMKRVA